MVNVESIHKMFKFNEVVEYAGEVRIEGGNF